MFLAVHPLHGKVMRMRKLLVAVLAALLLREMVPAATLAHGGAQDPTVAGPAGGDGGSEGE
jgi:Spy/CpxP family protein refolding chaperone